MSLMDISVAFIHLSKCCPVTASEQSSIVRTKPPPAACFSDLTTNSPMESSANSGHLVNSMMESISASILTSVRLWGRTFDLYLQSFRLDRHLVIAHYGLNRVLYGASLQPRQRRKYA